MDCRWTVAARRCVYVAFVALATLPLAGAAQVPGQNINMVTGIEYPNGDPFLQRQNEPSLAVSSVNPRHLLAGANDYRAVDLAAVETKNSLRTGDAWLGVFKSLDEGQTWRSTLLPGYAGAACNGPNRTEACELQAGADPVVRAGTDGMFYFAGLFFDRDRTKSRIAVSRFFDRNDSEEANFTIDGAGDPIEYLGVKAVAPDGARYPGPHTGCAVAGDHVHFLDKPWIAVDVPRVGARTCTIGLKDASTRSFAAGAVYVAYVEFVRPVLPPPQDEPGKVVLGAELSGNVMLSRSDDCGVSWSPPAALTTVATSAINEGPVIAIDPTTATVYVVWRRVASGSSQPDAIMVARSFSRGTKFTKHRVIATLPPSAPFDHPQGASSFRAWALPTFAISVGETGIRHLHVAWAQRDGADGPGRIFISTANVSPPPPSWQEGDETDASADRWSTPVAADPGNGPGRSARVQPDGETLSFVEGHQFMPALTASQGKVVLVYYDSRFDHARSLFKPNVVGGHFQPDANGRFYTEVKVPMTRTTGEWEWDPLGYVFGPDSVLPNTIQAPPRIDDSDVAQLRHTVDVRVGWAKAGPAPVFSSVQLSQYPFGRRGDETELLDERGELVFPAYKPTANGVPNDNEIDWTVKPLVVVSRQGTESKLELLQQLRQNPPNLPLFASGTRPFIGDYIDVQGLPFVRKGSAWVYNSAPSAAPVFHAVWTSNQDVRRPPPTVDANGKVTIDWTKYKPVPVGCSGGTCKSLFDGTSTVSCTPADVGFQGTRDQNIYTSRITEGLLVSSPQNVKALSATLYRTFVIVAQNTTWSTKNVRFTVTPPTGVVASFQDPALGVVTRVDAVIPPRSHASRAVIAKLAGSTNPAATITLRVDELDAGCDVTMNSSCPLASNGASGIVVLNPPGSPASLFSNPAEAESYDPFLVNVSLTPADPAEDPGVSSGVASHDIASHDIASHDIASHDIASHDIASHDIASHDIEVVENASHDIASHDIASHDIASHDIASHDIEDLASASHDIASHDIASLSDVNYTFQNDGNTTVSYDFLLAGKAPVDSEGRPLPVQLIITKAYRTPKACGCEVKQQPHTIPLVNIPDVTGAIYSLDASYPPSALDPSAGRASVAVESGAEIYVTLRAVASLTEMKKIADEVHVLPSPQNDPLSVAPPCTGPACTAPTFRQVIAWAVEGQAAKVGSKTTVTFAPSATPQYFRALVENTPPSQTSSPSGKVTFVVADAQGSRLLGVGDLAFVSGCVAPGCATTVDLPLLAPLASGAVVTAYYGGDGFTKPSSATWPLKPSTSVLDFSQQADGVLFAQVWDAAGGGTPTGTVTFTKGAPPVTPLGSAQIGANGIASLSNVVLLPTDVVTASYGGDGNYAGSAFTATPPARFSLNGHYYQVVCDRQRDWNAAMAFAQELTHASSSGHLAAITSLDENTFASSLLPAPRAVCGDMAYFLGGFQPEGTDEPLGGWSWVTGEPFTYAGWDGTPDDGAGGARRDEDVLMYWWRSSADPLWNRTAQPWNDGHADVPIGGYVVEYEPIWAGRATIDVTGQDVSLDVLAGDPGATVLTWSQNPLNDRSYMSVTKMGAYGQVAWTTYFSDSGHFDPRGHLAQDASGNTFVATNWGGFIIIGPAPVPAPATPLLAKLAPDGTIVAGGPISGYAKLGGMALDRARQRIWVAAAAAENAAVLLSFDLNLTLLSATPLSQPGGPVTSVEQKENGNTVALDAAGNVYALGLVDGSVNVTAFDPQGNFLRRASVPAVTYLDAASVSVGADGTVYVIATGNDPAIALPGPPGEPDMSWLVALTSGLRPLAQVRAPAGSWFTNVAALDRGAVLTGTNLTLVGGGTVTREGAVWRYDLVGGGMAEAWFRTGSSLPVYSVLAASSSDPAAVFVSGAVVPVGAGLPFTSGYATKLDTATGAELDPLR